MRQARKDLLKIDVCNEWECDIDLGLIWCDEVDFPCQGVML
jgi:hypothetical protein